jgi:hypothetical protein
MYDENSFKQTFEIGQHVGHKHKVRTSLLIHRKILIFGRWMYVFMRSNVGIQLRVNFQPHHARKIS